MSNLAVGSNSWADIKQANDYIGLSVNADAWNALAQDARVRSLISAFRLLNRVDWAGSITDPQQSTAWPRAGVTVNGQPVDETIVPDAIVNAQIEYALLISQDATLVSASTGDPTAGTRSLKAGSAAIEFFNNNPNTRIAGARRFPLAVHELITPYLAGAGANLLGGVVSGNDDCSQFDDEKSALFRGFA